MNFRERLKELRTARNMSQMALARATSISQNMIARWELGKGEPGASALLTLSQFFGVTIEYLLGVSDW